MKTGPKLQSEEHRKIIQGVSLPRYMVAQIRARMGTERGFSEVVRTALTRYLDVAEEDTPIYRIHTCDAQGQFLGVTELCSEEPKLSTIGRLKGGQVERLTDGYWNCGAGWYPTLAEAVKSPVTGYRIYTCDAQGKPIDWIVWQAADPTLQYMERVTGAYGCAIERVADGYWNYGGGWCPTLAKAVKAVKAVKAKEKPVA